MAETLRGILSHPAVIDSIKLLTELANKVVQPTIMSSSEHLKAFSTLATFTTALETGEAEIKIPIRLYQSKHDLDPDTKNNCDFKFAKKRGVCKERPILGTHRCFTHRIGGPADIKSRTAIRLPVISEALEEDLVQTEIGDVRSEVVSISDTALPVAGGKIMTFKYEKGTKNLVQVEATSTGSGSIDSNPDVGTEWKIPKTVSI